MTAICPYQCLHGGLCRLPVDHNLNDCETATCPEYPGEVIRFRGAQIFRENQAVVRPGQRTRGN